MSQSEDRIIVQTVNLTAYDKEFLHLSGAIQPHGILFALKEPQLEIIQVSNNTFELLGFHPQALLNQSLKDLLTPTELLFIEGCLVKDFESVNPIKLSIDMSNNIKNFDGILHRCNGVLILELEPKLTQEDRNFIRFYHLVKGAIAKLQNAPTMSGMCQDITQEVQNLTGFDRVMIYQFDGKQAGKVIAEEKREDLNSYLGLHYPASDIPDQAKKLYTRNRLRLIPDINSQPKELVPAQNPITNEPLDLSYAVLRSVSPCHLEYLRNMGVTASMSISLNKDKKLWGLIACHHYSPKYVSYEVRTACEFLGQVMSLELAAKEENENLDYKIKLKSIQAQFIEAMPLTENFMDGLVKDKDNLLQLVAAQGVAICANGDLSIAGETPSKSDIYNLIEWVEAKIDNDIFYTDCLPRLYPTAEKFKDVASGLIVLSISQTQKNYVLWFRPEVIQTVNWGGDPYSSVELSPRKSFELWQETVRSQSLPWKQCEIDAIIELRSAIVGIVLRKADELARINIELARSNSELDAFAYIASHDLKEPLRGIHNYSNFLIEDYADVLQAEGVSKLQTLVRLTQRMEDLINSLLHFSRLGRVELTLQKTDLNELVNSVIDILNISLKETEVDIRLPRPLPSVYCDPVQISEVFSNLISNAIKYNNKPNKLVEVGFLDTALNKPEYIVFYVKDNGIGIKEKHFDAIFRIFKRLHPLNKYGGGTGAGLTIAKKIVERHNGEIWVKSAYGEGSTFYFTLPSVRVSQ
ncbi:ATP-binding protein [Chroogloeocystis siderophila]|uniref:histidine kinase n=1 Tax=Chroogloeocystis siderophila 5.2 s.c.1 TaxID=247279 RepID=A0A1U7HLD0_9CHRO|nr:ATP-binding protein [Chroogloeocystis siderophila]OKH24364.1 cyanobacterial phytochrome A [Chroogloeocystis siderophila 5.2 s.c.1]